MSSLFPPWLVVHFPTCFVFLHFHSVSEKTSNDLALILTSYELPAENIRIADKQFTEFLSQKGEGTAER